MKNNKETKEIRCVFSEDLLVSGRAVCKLATQDCGCSGSEESRKLCPFWNKK